MKGKSLFVVLCAFILGILTTLAINSLYPEQNNPVTTTTYVIRDGESQKEDSSFVTQILSTGNEERPSPYDRISEGDITVDKNKVTINVQNAQWSRFTDTNSMDPVIDYGTNAIQIVPQSTDDIHVGDIVSYNSNYADGIIIHRVVEIGYDNKGWYAIMKGDNNNKEDPGKVRFSQIKRVVIAIIY